MNDQDFLDHAACAAVSSFMPKEIRPDDFDARFFSAAKNCYWFAEKMLEVRNKRRAEQ